MWHVVPGGQYAGHALIGAQLPVDESQCCPSGHVTPLHGIWKQPGTQVPLRHVWLAAHVTPAQGSRRGTQMVRHDWPTAHMAVPMHGSNAQCPERQIWPTGQSVAFTHPRPG
ncbi:MAG: hypothetical protein WCJ30_26300, partial [Deltaproteobacteria bacterium]